MAEEVEMRKHLVPRPPVEDKNWERCLSCRGLPGGARAPRPIPDAPAQGFSARHRVPTAPGCKNQWGLRLREREPSRIPTIPLKRPSHRPTQTHLLRAPVLGQQDERHQEHKGRNYSVRLQDKS